ncbi:YfiR family protein [Denitromonas iodatirespirans]|uniref:YfiR family protein n=1 Tax=Denitromonas iodatirespirans TaxID=2795389 RepID=A0A944DF78_DENI1|nr:YfiR family protein [Denitromonas iodatirespirans]MBT0963298.1 YfiR family protein [Denitromonas iodatirespirans]
MKRLRRALLCLAYLWACQPLSGATQTGAVPEFAMKAAYLYNFAQLVEWPASQAAESGRFDLCILGQDDIVDALEQMRGKTIDGRPLNPVRVTSTTDVAECRLFYVGEFGGHRATRLLRSLHGAPALTVADDRALIDVPTMITLLRADRRLGFEVDLGPAKHAQISFSSKLLGLARRVKTE